jgi:hypothetical protein
MMMAKLVLLVQIDRFSFINLFTYKEMFLSIEVISLLEIQIDMRLASCRV